MPVHLESLNCRAKANSGSCPLSSKQLPLFSFAGRNRYLWWTVYFFPAHLLLLSGSRRAVCMHSLDIVASSLSLQVCCLQWLVLSFSQNTKNNLVQYMSLVQLYSFFYVHKWIKLNTENSSFVSLFSVWKHRAEMHVFDLINRHIYTPSAVSSVHV